MNRQSEKMESSKVQEIIDRAESELHFNWYEERNHVWNTMKESEEIVDLVQRISREAEAVRKEVNMKYKDDRKVHFIREWSLSLSELADRFGLEKGYDVESDDFTMVVNTVAR